MLGLGFEQGHRDGLAFGVDLDPEGVVDAASRAPARSLAKDFDRSGSLLAADQILGPAPRVKGGIDQLRAHA